MVYGIIVENPMKKVKALNKEIRINPAKRSARNLYKFHKTGRAVEACLQISAEQALVFLSVYFQP
jgi:hypothetical protein